MRSNKRFTNSTFTKRVDHEAGRHHTKRAPKEPGVCSSCGAVFVNRRWTISAAGQPAPEDKHWHPAFGVLFVGACVFGFQFAQWPEWQGRLVGMVAVIGGVVGAIVGLRMAVDGCANHFKLL